MTRFASVLTDTRSVLSFLAGSGKIDSEIKKTAEAYLHQVDKGWESAVAIKSQSALYLDDLAVRTYLDHVRISNGADPVGRRDIRA